MSTATVPTVTSTEPNDAATTTGKIRTMLSSQSYNVNMIQPLEEYVMFMCRGTVPYMFDAVRILIKLYSLFPNISDSSDSAIRSSSSSGDKTKILDYMGLCCLLALTYGSSSNDIIALRYMIPTSYIPKDKVNLVSQVFHCATLYDNSMFTDFWTSYTSSFTQEATKSGLPVTELETTIRRLATAAIPILQTSIVIILSITYQQAPIDIVHRALHVTDLKEVANNNPTVIGSYDTNHVNFVSTTHNTQRHRTCQESMNYTTLSNLRFTNSTTTDVVTNSTKQ